MGSIRPPAISVIVPAYNVERYLPECLDSLLAQTHADFEVLIVDDGSTDGTPAVVARYAAENPSRVRAFTKPNGGLGDARNFGLDRALGTHVAFVDGDDLVAPTFLERLHARAVLTGAELVVCGMENFSDGEGGGTHYPEPDMSVFGHSLAEQPRLLYRVDASACDKLYARDLFSRSGIRFPVGLRFEDVPTTYLLLPYANRVEKIDEPLYRYRRDRPDSISSRYGERYLELIEGFQLVDDAYRESGIFESNREPLLRLHLTHLIAGRYPDLFLQASPSVRRAFITGTFELLDARFPGWPKSAAAAEVWRHRSLRFISTHRGALELFTALPPRVYVAALARLGAFDPGR